jgi:hypothetical protein
VLFRSCFSLIFFAGLFASRAISRTPAVELFEITKTTAAGMFRDAMPRMSASTFEPRPEAKQTIFILGKGLILLID